MSSNLPKSAQHIHETLLALGLNCPVIELDTMARSAADAASSVGASPEKIVKSLIFQTKITNQPVLVLVSGAHRLNETALEKFIPEGVRRATPDFVRAITGFAIGGVPPLGHKTKIPWVFMDQHLLNFEDIWAAAGTPHAVFCISGTDLLRVTQATLLIEGCS